MQWIHFGGRKLDERSWTPDKVLMFIVLKYMGKTFKKTYLHGIPINIHGNILINELIL